MRTDPKRDADALQLLAHRLALADELVKHNDGEHFDLAAPGSELAGDDEQLKPFQGSHYVAHCLSVSIDALRTARLVTVDPAKPTTVRLPMIGLYPLLRTAHEAAALATWLLAPDDRPTRLTRALQVRWSDVDYDNRMVLVGTEASAADDKLEVSRKQKLRRENARAVSVRRKRLRDLADKLGVTRGDLEAGRPGFGEILASVAPVVGLAPGTVRGAWHMVSGLTHPSVSRTLGLSVAEVLDHAGPDDETARVQFTASVPVVSHALEAAMVMHWTALDLVARRGGKDSFCWIAGPETPLPPGFRVIPR